MGGASDYIPEPSQLTVFGTVNSILKQKPEKLVFTTAPTQYIHALKGASSIMQQPFPLQCKLNLRSPHYTKTDGTPWAPDVKLNSCILLYGTLAGAKCHPAGTSNENQVDHFKLDINEIVYTAGGLNQNLLPNKFNPGKPSLTLHP